jgi:hypothetical protein
MSFGASECRDCGVQYRYASGRPIADLEEVEEDAPPAPPVPFQYPSSVEERPSAFVPWTPLVYALLPALAASAVVSFLDATYLVLLVLGVLDLTTFFTHPMMWELVDTLLGAVTLALTVLTAVMFLFWIHAATRSARSLSETELRYSPRAAVVWWFVPIASLVVPYRVMANLWKVSHATTVERRNATSSSAVLRWWWGLWLGTVVMERVADAKDSDTASIAASLLRIGAAVLAAWAVYSIQRGLAERARAGGSPD